MALGAAAGAEAQGITVEKPRWKNGAKAALSYIHDDLCGDTPGIFQHADTIAANRGVVFGAGAIVNYCKDWKRMDEMAARGHEIVSHSWSHANSKSWNAQNEINKGKETLEANLKNQKEVLYFIFPFDQYDATQLNNLKAAGFLASRSGGKGTYADRGVTSKFDAFDPFMGTLFHVFFTNAGVKAMTNHADQTIAAGGWANHEFHGVQDGSWEKVNSAADYRVYVDWIKAKSESNDIWNATPTQAIKYIMSVSHSGTPVVTGSTVTFPDGAKVPAKYAARITLFLTLPGSPATPMAQQGGNNYPIVKSKDGSKWMVDVDPTAGPINLVLSGSNASLARKAPYHGAGGRFGDALLMGGLPAGLLPKDGVELRIADMNGREIGKPLARLPSPGALREAGLR